MEDTIGDTPSPGITMIITLKKDNHLIRKHEPVIGCCRFIHHSVLVAGISLSLAASSSGSQNTSVVANILPGDFSLPEIALNLIFTPDGD
ncbi:MAG: hypothetical protein ABFC30_03535 [Proteiniphilum sp.]